MPLKSVVDVDVSQFEAFTANFQKYQEALAKTPAIWQVVGKENKAVGEGFKTMTAALLAQQEIVRKEAANQNDIAKASARTAGFWGSIAKDTKAVGGHIKEITTSLLKWDAVAGIFTGLLGIGGLWGFNRLAGSAGAGRRSTLGLGLSYGEQTAFGLIYGRVVDPGGFLTGISHARGNIASPEAAALFGLGINPSGAGDTGSTAIQALGKVRQLALQTPQEQLGILLQSRQLGALGLSVEDLRRIKSLSPREFDQYSRDYARRSRDLNLSPETLKKWQDFTVTLGEAEKKIQTGLIDGLQGLVKPLGHVTQGLSDAARALLGSEGFKFVVEKIASGLEWFARYVSTPQFKQDVIAFAHGIEAIARKFGWLFGAITGAGGGSPGPGPKGPPMSRRQWDQATEDALKNSAIPDAAKQRYRDRRAKDYDTYLKNYGPYTPASASGTAPPIGGVTVVPTNGKGGDALLDLVGRLEGSPDINGRSQVSPAGAIGKYQIMPGTAAGYGVSRDQLFDPATNRETARKLLADLTARYKGNLAEILTAYNAGPGVADYLRAHNDQYLPRGYGETQQYLHRAGIEVKIENNTGGNAIVQATAMGFPQ